jgi:hypothetical protein
LRSSGLVALLLVAASLWAGAAHAGGGASIASAPIVKLGAEQVQNTASDRTSTGDVGSGTSLGCWNDHEFWRVPLAAGDAVLLKGTSVSPGHSFSIAVFPAGTTDRNVSKATAIVVGFPDRAPVRFTARSTGTYALVAGPNCYDGTDGTFKFSVTVRHKR